MLRLLPLALLCAACNSQPEQHFDLAEVRAQYERDQDAFHRAQADVEQRYPVPMRLEFDDAGAIFVDQVALVGHPGKARLRVHFTWLNTGEVAYPVVDVRLTLRDAETETEWSDTLEMRLPYKHELTPDSSYTSWFETPTHGVHLREGWTWRLEVRPYEAPR